MRLPFLPLLILLAVNLVVDWYIYRVAVRRCKSHIPSRIQLFSAIALYLFIIVTVCLPRRGGSDETLIAIMWMLFGYFTVYIPKYLYVIIDLIARIPVLFHKRRAVWLSVTGGIVAVAVFGVLWWAALINRFNIDVNEITVYVPGLPEAFDGYTIAQFSDFHVGTYGEDTTYVSKVVDRLNSLGADMIVFTGDIVNRRSDELSAHVAPLSRLHARDGVFSILGNHDYGDYSDWASPADKEANMKLLYDLQRDMGWQLLLNEHRIIHCGNDSIALIGVENVGDPPFKIYGSLPEAYPSAGDSVTKILLSHNPAHWVDDIADNDSVNIALTLSGHTHAMQIEIGGWSPAKWRYPTWGGLYSDSLSLRQLYVNIGTGTVGIPMRLGATPELTLITLRPAEK